SGKDRPVLLVIATRGLAAGDAQMTSAQLLELPPFSTGEALQTVRQLVPGINPFLCAEIGRYSGGNPLFLEELCHSAATDRHAGRPLGPHGEAAWLNELILSR